MSYELILKNIQKHIDLDEAEMAIFCSKLKIRNIPKKALLLEAGENCRYISYVHRGMLRAYHLDKEGRESTIMFAARDWWITDMYCFLNDIPAMMHIETLADSCIIQLSKEHLDQLYIEIPKLERFFRILMQNAYTREQLRVIENLSLPADERYTRFLTKYLHIAEAVTQKQIASYLGITPEFLSAVKKNRKS